jgi:hypothetical protein
LGCCHPSPASSTLISLRSGTRAVITYYCSS